MKRILALALVFCLIACCLPMAATAETTPTETTATAVKATVKVRNIDSSKDMTWAIAVGKTVYVVSDENKGFVKWTGKEPPTDHYAKFEHVGGEPSLLKATLKNLVIDISSDNTKSTRNAIEFKEGDYAVEMELIGDNIINNHHASAIKFYNTHGLTIFGDGTLSITQGSAEVSSASAGAIWGYGGDMVIKANINVSVSSGDTVNPHHAFLASKGNIIFDGAKISSKTDGGQVAFLGVVNSSSVRCRNDLDPATDRFIFIKNSEITSNAKHASFKATNPVTISNSTLTLTKRVTNTDAKYAVFNNPPQFEGEYTAMGGLATKPENAKAYNPKKINSYTYFSVLPYAVPTEPTEEETVPPTTQPAETQPAETKPVETKPVETKPVETKPAETKPTETTPEVTEPNEPTEPDSSTSPLKVAMIISICTFAASGMAVGVLWFLKKKKA